jgi:hypothetical protein
MRKSEYSLRDVMAMETGGKRNQEWFLGLYLSNWLYGGNQFW